MQPSYGPSPEMISALRESLDAVVARLVGTGEDATGQRLRDLERRLASGDMSAIGSILSETMGGMGSLNDVPVHRRPIEELRQRAEAARASPWRTQWD